jgi:hypothetical protein
MSGIEYYRALSGRSGEQYRFRNPALRAGLRDRGPLGRWIVLRKDVRLRQGRNIP